MKSRRIKFFGNYFSSNGLEPDPGKIAAIVDMSPPTSAQELQSFLGMVNYLGRYTPDLATTTAPLRDLIKKDSVFLWVPEHQKAFNNVKEAITAPSTLANFDPASQSPYRKTRVKEELTRHFYKMNDQLRMQVRV